METLKRSDRIIIYFLFILLVTIACEKETEYDVLSGQLIGYINLYDSNRTILSDKSGVEIIVEGTNPQQKALTNVDGQFIIDDLKSGIYNIIFNKEGYCQHKIVSHQFVGGNKPATLYETTLYGILNLQIDNPKIIDLDNPYSVEFRVSAKVTNQNGNTSHYCRYYLSNDPDISYKNYVSSDVAITYNEELFFSLQIDTLKFPIGSELYLIMYPASESYQYYTDLNTGKKIYTSININKPSQVANITIPEVEAPYWLK